MTASSTGSPWTPLRDRLNASGIPFQLAVERFMRDRGPQYGFSFVGHEVAWEKGFLDILFRKSFIFLAMECKKVDDDTWVFVLTEESQQSRCRLGWYNPRLPDPELPVFGQSKVFCSEFNIVESSPESEFSLLPKGGPNKILEPLASELIDACRDILDDSDRAHDADHWEVMVPVIVTNARLVTCRLDPRSVDLATGSIQSQDEDFNEVPFIRFRKTLVTYRSDPTLSTPVNVASWVSDRERTVFVVGARHLTHFMHGFRSFYCLDEGGDPKEWNNPPGL